MYRITKVLNHNTVLAVKDKSAREYLIVGKGVGFGKKITQSVEPTEEDSLYELTQTRDRGPAKDIVKSIEPEYLEIANTLLDNAEHEFGHIDRSILFPMADHIAFAVKRMENKEQISNPLNDDIRVMFYREYKIAENIRHILKDKKQIDITTMAYNRLMNHIRHMVSRAATGEKLKVDLNQFIEKNYPESFALAGDICKELGKDLNHEFLDNETGYLAIHIEQIKCDEMVSE